MTLHSPTLGLVQITFIDNHRPEFTKEGQLPHTNRHRDNDFLSPTLRPGSPCT